MNNTGMGAFGTYTKGATPKDTSWPKSDDIGRPARPAVIRFYPAATYLLPLYVIETHGSTPRNEGS